MPNTTYSPKVVARMLGVASSTVCGWIGKQYLPASNMSGNNEKPRWAIDQADLQRFTEKHTVEIDRARSRMRKNRQQPASVNANNTDLDTIRDAVRDAVRDALNERSSNTEEILFVYRVHLRTGVYEYYMTRGEADQAKADHDEHCQDPDDEAIVDLISVRPTADGVLEILRQLASHADS